MTEDVKTRMNGTPETAAWFREQLALLGHTQTTMARFMERCDDDRQFATIRRNIQRMATGEARVSGEMRVLLHFLRAGQTKREKRVVQTA